MRSTSKNNIHFRFPWILFLCLGLWTSIGLSFPQAAFADLPTASDNAVVTSLSNTSVDENIPSGTVVGTFNTTDANISDSHTYTLIPGTGDTDNLSFRIVDDTLQTKEVFDFEAQSSYSIRVRTDDQNGGTYDKEFIINIIDHDEITLEWDANYRTRPRRLSGISVRYIWW